MRKTFLVVFIFFLAFPFFPGIGQNPFEKTASWKFSIPKSGVYKIDYPLLQKVGIDPAQLNPKNISIFAAKGGMLPQLQNSDEPFKTLEIPIRVVGENDQVFDGDDYILFYVPGPDEEFYYKESEEIFIEKNLYDTANYCFLTMGNSPGKRVAAKSPVTGGGNIITHYDHFVHVESEWVNLNTSGRYWFGENLAFNENKPETSSVTFSFPEQVTANSLIKIYTNALTTAPENAQLQYTLNDKVIGTLSLPKITKYVYGAQGKEKSAYFEVNSGQLVTTNPLDLTIENITTSGYNIYLDYVTLNLKKPLIYDGSPLVFSSFESANQVKNTYVITAPDGVAVWDISKFPDIKSQPYSSSDDEISFNSISTYLEKFAVFSPSEVPMPEFIAEIPPYSLPYNSTEFLIITHPSFASEARRLANFRKQHDRLATEVVTVDQIYNVYSSGRQDVTAIRNYIKDLYDGGSLRYVLLFGDASYDYKSPNSSGNTNWVPTYQSRNAIHNVQSYASDDYFTFLEDFEGIWSETGSNLSDHTMDIGIGRLPVASPTEAKIVVDKLIHYASGNSTLGDWRNHIAFFADDGDDNIHQYQSDYLADYVSQSHPQFTSNKFFMDKYPKESIGNNRKRSPQMAEKVRESVVKGALIIDFIGHGSESAWTNESILTTDMFSEWENRDNLPLFMTATCEFGRYDDWRKISAAEQLVLSEKGGAIAMLTTTRPVFFTTNFSVSSAFYEYAFQKTDEQWPRLGDLFRYTKNNSIEDVVNRNFSLLGDPSMRLAYPEKDVAIEKKIATKLVETETGNWVEMKLEGKIQKGSGSDQIFSGELEYKLFDKKKKISTLGNEGQETVFEYYSRENILAKGRTNVNGGHFEFTLLVPEEFTKESGIGKMNFYAVDASETTDAAGSLIDFSYDSTDLIIEKDSIPPDIRFWVDGLEMINGKKLFKTDSITIVIGDNYGIKLFKDDTIHLIHGSLAGPLNIPLQLSDNFDPDAGSSASGKVALHLSDLVSGSYRLTVSSTDLAGNFTTHSVDFYIIEKSELLVYPNPASEFINFRFTIPADVRKNLAFDLTIFSPRGEKIGEFVGEGNSSEVRLEKSRYPLLFIPGFYVYRASLSGSGEVITGKFVVR